MSESCGRLFLWAENHDGESSQPQPGGGRERNGAGGRAGRAGGRQWTGSWIEWQARLSDGGGQTQGEDSLPP